MADIPISYYKAVVRSQKFNPVNPPSMEDPPPVLNPPGSGPTADFVPYEGASRDVDLGANDLTLDSVKFNDLTPNGILPRQLRWNNEDSTLDLGMGLGGVIQQMGQEVYHSPVKNQTGVTIPDGSLVAYSGSVGASGRINIQLAIGDGTIESRKILGIATHEILNGADGLVTWFGKVRGINTTGTPVGETWVLGNTLWAHPTQPGKLTNVKPVGPNLKVSVGVVVNVHATQGTILINTSLGSNLEELHNVSVVTPTTNDILQLNSGGVWVNKSLSGAGIVGGGGTINYLQKITSAGVIGDSQIFDNGTNIGIGTTTPTYILDIGSGTGNKILRLNGGTGAGEGGLFFVGGVGAFGSRAAVLGSGTSQEATFAAYNGNPMVFSVDAGVSNSMYINTTGKVGIGTNAPQGNLDVFTSANAATVPVISLRSNLALAGRYAMIRFGDQSQTTNYQKGAIIVEGTSGEANMRFHIALENTSGPTSVALSDAKVTVLPNGNVGFLTVDPTNTIDVNGTARIRSIANLGIPATNVMVPSATGVVNLRTVAEFRGDIGAQATIAGTDTHVLFFDGANNPAGDNGLVYLKSSKRLIVADVVGSYSSDIVADKSVGGNGNVGILLQNRSSGGEASLTIRNDSTYAAFEIFGSAFGNVPLRNTALFTTGSPITLLAFATLGAAPIDFRTNTPSGDTNTRIRILGTNGNVLINTTTDAGYKLHVNGSFYTSGLAVFDSNLQIALSTFSLHSSGGNSLKIGSSTTGASFAVQNVNAAGFSGIEYIDNAGAVTVFTGYNNGSVGEFRFNNIATNAIFNFMIGSATKMQVANSGNILIGTTTDIASALLNLTSTTKGFLPPRMTGAQAEAIATPSDGLLVYINSGNGTTITSVGWWGRQSSVWVKLN